MERDMILSIRYGRPLSSSQRRAYGVKGTSPVTLWVTAGLWHPGNGAKQPPHFSVTGEIIRRVFGRRDFLAGGCIHEEVLAAWPKLAPIVALHLSDEDGTPMHAEENGWYKLCGYFGGLREDYHAGNSERNFPITPDPATPWKTTEYRRPTPDECLEDFARHIRVSREEAAAIAERVAGSMRLSDLRSMSTSAMVYPDLPNVRKTLRMTWAAECAAMRPRWKEEADAAIRLLESWGATRKPQAATA